jgi:hypothetical protein
MNKNKEKEYYRLCKYYNNCVPLINFYKNAYNITDDDYSSISNYNKNICNNNILKSFDPLKLPNTKILNLCIKYTNKELIKLLKERKVKKWYKATNKNQRYALLVRDGVIKLI